MTLGKVPEVPYPPSLIDISSRCHFGWIQQEARSQENQPIQSIYVNFLRQCGLRMMRPESWDAELIACFFFFLSFFLVFYFLNFKIFNSYMRSQTWTPLPPPHNISLGHPHAPAPSMLYPASDMDWRFNSYMTVYMLECHSPKSSHPLPLTLSPKVRYTHLCLFSCLAYRVVIAIFLNSIYMC